MRKISKLENKEQLELAQYILMNDNIESFYDDKDPNDRMLWVRSDSDLNRAKLIIEKFSQDPTNPKYKVLAEKGRQVFIQKHKEIEKKYSKSRFINVRTEIFSQGALSNSPVTKFLITFSVLIFIVQFFDQTYALKQFFLISKYVSGLIEIQSGEIWRPVTPIFLHQGFLHILFNMTWLYLLGARVEARLGAKLMIFLIIFVSVSSNLSFYFVAHPVFGGMSGVNYGLFGYMWAMNKFSSRPSYLSEESKYTNFFLIWFVACWVLTVFGFYVANTIHGVGALSGMIFAYFHAYLTSQSDGKTSFPLPRTKEHVYSLLIIFVLILGAMFTDYLCSRI
ncbi:MAG: hypothetical protein CMP11_07500 [Zetaproteobacteria bacterium]|nr:hypothetical protein [Pseudobdellovibrionaceae bacterium]